MTRFVANKRGVACTTPGHGSTTMVHASGTAVNSKGMRFRTHSILHVLALVVLAIVTGCGSHEIDGDKVYYVYWNEAHGKNRIQIQGADAASFKGSAHPKYAVDKNSVYYEAGKLADANPRTFTSILDYYGKDDRFAYKGDMKIEGADAPTFEVIGGGPYAKDKKDYYFNERAMHVSDMGTFKILNGSTDFGYWAKDRHSYYLQGKKYPLVDYETFEMLGHGYAKDRSMVYFQDSVVAGADPGTFKTMNYAYAQDRNAVFREHVRLLIKDPHSFQILQGGYSKDKYEVYCGDSVVVGADPATFEFVTGSMWTKDKSSYFFAGKRIPLVDYATFRYLDYNYAVDKRHVYYNDQVIEEADASSFQHIEDSQDGKDKQGCYRYGERVDCSVLLEED